MGRMQTLLLRVSLAGHPMSFSRSLYLANKTKASKTLENYDPFHRLIRAFILVQGPLPAVTGLQRRKPPRRAIEPQPHEGGDILALNSRTLLRYYILPTLLIIVELR